MIANTLDDAWRVCDPDQPLQANDTRYVDLSAARNTKNVANQIRRRILRSEGDDFHHQLFTGHRGSGKSTELLRLKAELEANRVFTIYFDTEEMLDLVEVNYLDVLLGIAQATEAQLRDAKLALNKDLLDEISNWFADTVLESEEKEAANAELKAEASAGGRFIFGSLLSKFTADIKTSSGRRTVTRQRLENELPEFVKRLNNLLGAARDKVRKHDYIDLVLIVDGLEKMHYRLLDDGQYSTHSVLFVQHATQLKAPACHIIYTVPISLLYNSNLGQDYDEPVVLPMVKLDDEGRKALRKVIEKRLNIDAVFDPPDLLDTLVKFSGGVMRDLMRLIRMASDTDEPKIGPTQVEYALNALTREYDRLLQNPDLPRLQQVTREQRIQIDDEEYNRLLNLRIVLEYQNGKRWADLHPAVRNVDWVKAGLNNA